MERAPEATDPMKVHPPNGILSAWIAGHFPPGFQGFAIDVGASDGVSVNSTFVLEKNRWTVLSVEPNPKFHPILKTLRAWVETCAVDAEPGRKTFYSFIDNPEAYSALRPTFPSDFPLVRGDAFPSGWEQFEVEVRTLDQLLAKWEFPRLDCLCIDTEGTELDVLKGLDLARWLPKVIIAESWTEETPIDEYLAPHGYTRSQRFVHNNYYVRKDP